MPKVKSFSQFFGLDNQGEVQRKESKITQGNREVGWTQLPLPCAQIRPSSSQRGFAEKGIQLAIV